MLHQWHGTIQCILWFSFGDNIWPHDLKSFSCSSLDLDSSFHYPSFSFVATNWSENINGVPKWNQTKKRIGFLFQQLLCHHGICSFFSVSFQVSMTAKARMYHRKASPLRTSQPLRKQNKICSLWMRTGTRSKLVVDQTDYFRLSINVRIEGGFLFTRESSP